MRFIKGFFIFMTCALLLMVTLGGLAFYVLTETADKPQTNGKKTAAVQAEAEAVPALSGPLNILLMGIDDGDPEIPKGPRRSDAMLVASIHPEQKSIQLLSIPRDTRVPISGRSGYDKIAHAFFYGGAPLSVRTVEEALHIPIDYYMVIDWQAFIKVVDILGGVDLYVEQDMNYEDPYENLAIHLRKGQQHLDGEKAGQYVRFRHDELGDIGRVQRQQEFLQVLGKQLLQPATLFKIPALVTTVSRYVQTDMSTYTLLKLANALKEIRPSSIYSSTLPGDFATLDEISYWVPDKKGIESVASGMMQQTVK